MTSVLQSPSQTPIPPRELRNTAAVWMYVVIALIALTPFCWSVESALIRLRQPNPQSPWEAQILMDAWRANHGLRVYALTSANDHATHMYGTLITYCVAAIFRVAGGFNVHAARWISAFSGISLIAILVWNFARRNGWLFAFIATSILAATFYRARGYLSEGRPDVISILFSVIALWMLHLAFTRHAAWMIGGVAMMILGFFFKQPAAIIAFVPGIALLMLGSRRLNQLALAAIPPIAMFATVMILKFCAPALYFYMIQGQDAFEMHWNLLAEDIVDLLSTNVLFTVTLVLWIFGIARSNLSRPATVWLLAACGLEAIFTGMARIKEGGQVNGYLPAYIALNTFAIVVLPGVIEQIIEITNSQWKRIAFAILIGALFFADVTIPVSHIQWAMSDNLYGDASYKKIVRRARQLHGVVICPDDPTIALQAKNYVGRNLTCELDALGRKSWPPYLKGELQHADYVIRVNGVWTPLVRVASLEKLGYTQVKDKAFEKTAYSLWQKKHKPAKPPATHASNSK